MRINQRQGTPLSNLKNVEATLLSARYLLPLHGTQSGNTRSKALNRWAVVSVRRSRMAPRFFGRERSLRSHMPHQLIAVLFCTTKNCFLLLSISCAIWLVSGPFSTVLAFRRQRAVPDKAGPRCDELKGPCPGWDLPFSSPPPSKVGPIKRGISLARIPISAGPIPPRPSISRPPNFKFINQSMSQ